MVLLGTKNGSSMALLCCTFIFERVGCQSPLTIHDIFPKHANILTHVSRMSIKCYLNCWKRKNLYFIYDIRTRCRIFPHTFHQTHVHLSTEHRPPARSLVRLWICVCTLTPTADKQHFRAQLTTIVFCHTITHT